MSQSLADVFPLCPQRERSLGAFNSLLPDVVSQYLSSCSYDFLQGQRAWCSAQHCSGVPKFYQHIKSLIFKEHKLLGLFWILQLLVLKGTTTAANWSWVFCVSPKAGFDSPHVKMCLQSGTQMEIMECGFLLIYLTLYMIVHSFF